jgi:hypothetical protein
MKFMDTSIERQPNNSFQPNPLHCLAPMCSRSIATTHRPAGCGSALIQALAVREKSVRLVVLIIAAILITPSAQAAELASADAAVALTDQVMKRIATGDLRGGMEVAKPYTIVPAAEFDVMIGQAELQMPMMVSRFGKSIGYELIRNDTVGGSLIQVLQLQKFEKHATVWQFTFYRGANGCVLNSFKYADDISAAF